MKRKKPAYCKTCGQPHAGSHLLDPCQVCLREGERRGLLRAARAIDRLYKAGKLSGNYAAWCRAEAKKLKEAKRAKRA